MARQGRPASGRRNRSTGTVSVTDLLRREQPAKAIAIEETAVLPSDLAWLLRDEKTWARDRRPEFEPVTGSLTAIDPAEQTSTDLVVPLAPAPGDQPDGRTGRRLALLGVGPRMFGVALLAAIGAGTWVAGSATGSTTLTGEATPAPQAQPAAHGTGATVREAGAPLAAMAPAAPAPAVPAAAPAKQVSKPAPRRPVTKPAPPSTPTPPVVIHPVVQPPTPDWNQYAQEWEQYYYSDPGYYYGDGGDHDGGSHGKHHHHHH